MTADQLVKILNLKPHPEGGFFRETYKSPVSIPGINPERVYSTSIYYLLVSGSVSKLHKLLSDEVIHFYLGDPVTWVLLKENGKTEKTVMGSLVEHGQQLQTVVKAGTWFGGYLNEGGNFALMGMTVAPGFEFEDLTLGEKQELIRLFPKALNDISRLA